MSSRDIIREIIRGIAAECSHVQSLHAPRSASSSTQHQHLFSDIKHTQTSDILAAFMIRSVLLDPAQNFSIDAGITKEHFSRLVATCVQKICGEDDIQMDLIKMQIYFDSHFPAQCTPWIDIDEFLKREKQTKQVQSQSILVDLQQLKPKAATSYESK